MTAQEFYASVYQQPLLLILATLPWIGYWLLLGPDHPLRRYCLAFATLSVVDAWLTANTVLGLGALPGALAAVVPVFFVILGDFRVFLLLVGEWGAARGWLKALALSLIVPVASIAVVRMLPQAWQDEKRTTFLVYELLLFALIMLVVARVRAKWVERGDEALLKRWAAYASTYYLAWIIADVWLLASSSEASGAWTLRVFANLLYYAGWTPWVYFTRLRSSRSLCEMRRAPASA